MPSPDGSAKRQSGDDADPFNGHPDQAVVVADRRLTRGTSVVEVGDEEKGTNKGFLLLETLMDVREPDHRIEGIVGRLAEAATAIEELEIASKARRLSIAMAGYVYDEELPRGVLVHISNFESATDSALAPLDEAQGHFSAEVLREERPPPTRLRSARF